MKKLLRKLIGLIDQLVERENRRIETRIAAVIVSYPPAPDFSYRTRRVIGGVVHQLGGNN